MSAEESMNKENADPAVKEMANFFSEGLGISTKEEPKRLDMVRWMAAAENMSMAYAFTDVWQFSASRAHIRNCMQIAGETLHLVSAPLHPLYVCSQSGFGYTFAAPCGSPALSRSSDAGVVRACGSR